MSDNQIEKKVLALKYRPKRFEDLVGQSTISQTLSLALDSNRLSHAYLFSGLRGSGKTSTARIMAKALLCSTGPTSRPCETCENCLSANTNRHLDIIEMDAASNRGIDDIKDLIEHTKYKPSSARFKVFIIDEVHMLTTQAFNALLKTLEEPPGFVKFILATTDALKLPATILSRTQHFRFNKIASSDVNHHLSHILNEENIDFETPALEILTRSGQGSLRDTLTLLDQAIIFSKGKVTTNAVVDMLGLIEPELMDKVFDIILKKLDFIELVKELENYEISQVCDEMTIYLKQKMLEKDARFDLLLFDRFFRILSDAKHLLALNSDSGFVLILTIMKMIEATEVRTIDDIINQVEQIEVKPMMKEAISTKKVIEHAHNDVNHAYDDKPVNIAQQLEANKNIQIQEPVQEIETPSPAAVQEEVTASPFENETIIESSPMELNTLDAVPVVEPIQSAEEPVNNFSNPFDETPFEENTLDLTKTNLVPASSLEKPKPELVEEIPSPVNISEDATPFDANPFESPSVELAPSPVLNEEVQIVPETTGHAMHNPSLEEVVAEPIAQVEIKEDPNVEIYQQVIEKVYERDGDLGIAFEKNFVFKSFENNVLKISSFAQDEERKFLFKHFGVIKMFIFDVFGNDIELDFLKEEASSRRV